MSTGRCFSVILALVLIVWMTARLLRRRKRRVVRRRPWDAGLVRLQPEMTYTATAFAAPVRVLFERLLKPVVAEHAQQHGAFVVGSNRREQLSNVVERLLIRPISSSARVMAEWLARMHHGSVTAYAGYVLVALLIVLLIGRVLL